MPSISSSAAADITQFHQLIGPPSIHRPPPPSELRGLTDNGSATYLPTNNPLLDFFFHVVPDTPHEDVINRLAKAWKHDPLTALKLICNLRGLGGTGESHKEGFYAAAIWLHEHHPKTLAANLKAMSEFGYLKDLPEILFRLHRKTLKDAWREEKLSVAPLEVRTVKAASVVGGADDRISDLFAELLISDLKYLNSGEVGKISLASKWCPSLDSSFDRATLLCETIARRIFPRDSHPEVYVSSTNWERLLYNRASSVAMKEYQSFFHMRY